MAAMSALPYPRDRAQGPRLHVQLERHSDSRHPAVPDSHTYWSIASSPSLRSRDAGDLDRPLKLERSLTPIAGQNGGFNSARILGSNPSSMCNSNATPTPPEAGSLSMRLQGQVRARCLTVSLRRHHRRLHHSRRVLKSKPKQHVQLDRYSDSNSDSASGYITLTSPIHKSSRLLPSAAMVKLKLLLESTTRPVNIPVELEATKEIIRANFSDPAPSPILADNEDDYKGTCAKVGDDLKAQDAKLTEQIKELAKKPAKDSTPATTTAADVPQPDTPVEQTSTPHQDGMKKVPSQESY
ncbi:uncharacterized protein MYCGRDRAFT_97729 [Zymoseptoria tritici IPO323]|uniref:Uncharacterized protein n=1 Tax=Zymoseptoria tritici (strain CBS 115943 / IPO323) TaxID=336722 RepID=F9XR69_ZYMTI|nr:uncharacterized protein MYCGRDRAFT_97729 [Zymoseptoria tritici IPO323]EGP82207.1 hypothetical protein MYCGRDRAFT_97729 [Zymoseptoria tritici IPO323]